MFNNIYYWWVAKQERTKYLECGVSSICNLLHIELHLICSIVCCTLPCHDSLNRTCIILLCASCHDYARVFTMLFVSFRCYFLVPITLRLWGFVRLHPFVFFMDSFFFLAGFQARWPLPWISLLSLLCYLLRSIALSRYLSLVNQAFPICHVSL